MVFGELFSRLIYFLPA